MVNIPKIMSSLTVIRPVFQSEADFQHALAWEIHRGLPEAQVRLEVPVASVDAQMHIDVWVKHENKLYAIELKYKTRALSVQVGEEQFLLKDQSAQTIGRYDFIKDVQRLERVLTLKANTIGYAILLTNDSAYWVHPRGNRTVDADFRLHEGRSLGGLLQWGEDASAGTKHHREDPLTLAGTYPVRWVDYSKATIKSYGTFRYLFVEVDKQ